MNLHDAAGILPGNFVTFPALWLLLQKIFNILLNIYSKNSPGKITDVCN